MKEVDAKLHEVVKAVIHGKKDQTVTNYGRAGHGNTRLRTYYEGNLVAAVHYRHDIHVASKTDDSVIKGYIDYILGVTNNEPGHIPWQVIDADFNLADLPKSMGRNPNSTLRESLSISDAVLGVFQSFPREGAWMRAWKAGNGGEGVEFAIVYKDEKGTHLYEAVINYYFKLNGL